jgi:hypothetical protein
LTGEYERDVEQSNTTGEVVKQFPDGDGNTSTQGREPDRAELVRFIETVFKHADSDGYVAMRMYKDDVKRSVYEFKRWRTPALNGADRSSIVDDAVIVAGVAAAGGQGVVFCPPVATFKDSGGAGENNLDNGLVISVELDARPRQSLVILQDIIGQATLVVASGGRWVDDKTGEEQDKLHLHWRLAVPTRTAEEHTKLKEARWLAATLVGADTTGCPVSHCYRWPGSWHLKDLARARLARIVEESDREITDLDTVISALEEAIEAAGLPAPSKGNGVGGGDRTAPIEQVREALGFVSNDWKKVHDGGEYLEWFRIGYSIAGATECSDAGYDEFLKWSRKNKTKFNEANTERQWKAFTKHPPTRIGAGTLFFLAKQHGFRFPVFDFKRDWNELGDGGVVEAAKPEPEGVGVSLKDFYAYMLQHNYMYAPARDLWPGSSVNARLPRVPLLDKRGNPVLNKKGEPVTISATSWLDEHRPVEQMTWAPGLPIIIKDRLISEGGWIERKKVSCFNLYRPPNIKPGDASKAAPWLNHVRKVYPDDADHIIKWFAQRVQHPEEKINHALLLGGDFGIGKDTMVEPVKVSVGRWNFSEVSPKQMTGRFNGFLRSVILRINEVRDLGNELDRFGFYDHMKAYTAAPPDVLRVDEKNLREHSIVNCCGIIMTTNHKTDGIYLPAGDRRHYVAWSELTEDDFEDGYWPKLWHWYEKENGYEHVAALLADLDLSGFDPKAPPRKTAAFWSIVDASRTPEESELADVIELLREPDAVTIKNVADNAPEAFAYWLRERKNSRIIPHRFEACGYIAVRNSGAKDGQWVVGGKRQTIYTKTALSLKEQVIAAQQLARTAGR